VYKQFYFLRNPICIRAYRNSFSQVNKDTGASSHNHNGLSTTATLQNSAASIAVINRTDLNKGDGVILTSVLNKIPGVYMQQGALNTNRISIRGIGSRAQYGTQK
jgi:iron complex outermembrane receptor protein